VTLTIELDVIVSGRTACQISRPKVVSVGRVVRTHTHTHTHTPRALYTTAKVVGIIDDHNEKASHCIVSVSSEHLGFYF